MVGEIVISLAAVIICAAAFINALSFPGGTSDGVPGAGVFPQALCAIIILINLILIFRAARDKKKTEPETEEQKIGFRRLALIALCTAGFIVLWGSLHFVIICSVYLILVGLILKQNMKTFAPGAVVSSILVFYIFQEFLNVMLNN